MTSRLNMTPTDDGLARKVVGRCGGLPLAILSLGSLMSANGMSDELLFWVLERINQGQNQTAWLHAWKQYSADLSETMRKCLYSFAIFPIDFQIPARRLVSQWLAEGWVMQNEEFDGKKETPEDVAERCLEKLRDCNFIQVLELRTDGRIKTCCLPSTLRELILQESDRADVGMYSSTHLERRLAFYVNDQHNLNPNFANVSRDIGLPLSICFFDYREEQRLKQEHIGNVLCLGIACRQFMEITFLDLEGVFRPQLPEPLIGLINLKYLGLRWTYLKSIPTFIAKLLNLETLDLKNTYIAILPSSILRLKKLRHLHLNQTYRSQSVDKLRGSFLDNLQTLAGVVINSNSPILHDLPRLRNLRNLKLAFCLTRTKQELLVKLIGKLSQLRLLRLKSMDEMGRPSVLYDTPVLENLSSLYLLGSLEHESHANGFPKNLTHLTLSASRLLYDPMPLLENLPWLRTLFIYAGSYNGEKMVCSRGGFPQLRVLKLWKLEHLEEWIVEEGAIPRLLELEIRSCSKLKVPSGLNHLKNLHNIKLTNMPNEFVIGITEKRIFWDDVQIVQV